MRSLLLLTSLMLTAVLNAQNILGRWTSIDDETGKKKSVVEITERGGRLFGRVVQLFREPHENQDPVCNECDPKDDRYQRKVIGMEIIRDMVLDPGSSPGEWVDGTILDPKNGSVYDCKLWLENGKLKVRGYVAFFYRTQTWVRD